MSGAVMVAPSDEGSSGQRDWDGLVFDAEWAADLDRAFFADQPDRFFRVRELMPGEMGPDIAYAGPDAGAVLLVIVARGFNVPAKQIVSCHVRWPADEDAEIAALLLPKVGGLQ